MTIDVKRLILRLLAVGFAFLWIMGIVILAKTSPNPDMIFAVFLGVGGLGSAIVAGMLSYSLDRNASSWVMAGLILPGLFLPILAILAEEGMIFKYLYRPNVERLKARRQIYTLISLLRFRDESVRKKSAQALMELGAEAVRPLIDVLQIGEMNVEYPPVGILLKIGASAVEPLIAVMKSENNSQSFLATWILGKTRDKRAWPHLLEALRNKEAQIRYNAATALEEFADPRAGGHLINALGDNDINVQTAVISALGALGGAASVEPLIGVLKSAARDEDDDTVYMAAAKALAGFKDEDARRSAIKQLCQALGDEDERSRSAFGDILLELSASEKPADSSALVIGGLISLFQDDSESGAWAYSKAAELLGEIGAPAVDPLLKALKSRSPLVRTRAIPVLSAIGDSPALEGLRAARSDKNADVRNAAEDAFAGFEKAVNESEEDKMNTYHNKKWSASLEYPRDWELMWENEAEGGWEIVVGVAGRPSRSGGPCVTVRVIRQAVINLLSERVAVFAAGGPGEPEELSRTPEEYNQGCKRELMQALPGVRFISEETGTLAGMPSGTLLYSYKSQTGTIREKQVNLFGSAVTYRLLCEAPIEQSESVERYFDTVLKRFEPFAG